eukprot:5813658-Pleurochrysis_carterae.AAC.1
MADKTEHHDRWNSLDFVVASALRIVLAVNRWEFLIGNPALLQALLKEFEEGSIYKATFINDLEPPAFQVVPLLREIKEDLGIFARAACCALTGRTHSHATKLMPLSLSLAVACQACMGEPSGSVVENGGRVSQAVVVPNSCEVSSTTGGGA